LVKYPKRIVRLAKTETQRDTVHEVFDVPNVKEIVYCLNVGRPLGALIFNSDTLLIL
jgi:hypothetical protein